MQSEVAEVFKPSPAPAGGAPAGEGAAALPSKLKPGAAATLAVTAAMIAPQLVATILSCAVQEHERAFGAWQAEWATFPALALVTSGALGAVADLAQGVEVDPDRMRGNVDITHGLIMAEAITFALAAKMSRPEAQKLVEQASQKAIAEKRSLQNVLGEDTAGHRASRRSEARPVVRAYVLPGGGADLHRSAGRLAQGGREQTPVSFKSDARIMPLMEADGCTFC
jgi:3-carboxy-cis,cis-muconate cycloisomerase